MKYLIMCEGPNSTAFYRDYFGENPKMLAESIREYRRRNGSHKNDEGYLAELLK